MNEYDDILIRCPGCDNEYTAPVALAGDVGTCAACGSDIPIVRARRKEITYNKRPLFGRIREGFKKWRARK